MEQEETRHSETNNLTFYNWCIARFHPRNSPVLEASISNAITMAELFSGGDQRWRTQCSAGLNLWPGCKFVEARRGCFDDPVLPSGKSRPNVLPASGSLDKS